MARAMRALLAVAAAALGANSIAMNKGVPPAEVDSDGELRFGAIEADHEACLAPSNGTEVLREILDKVWKGDYSSDVAKEYIRYQESLIQAIQTKFPKQAEYYEEVKDRKLKVLIMLAVANSAWAVSNFQDNLEVLRRNTHGDTFEYAIFHHDLETSLWDANKDYANQKGVVVMKHREAGCKPHFWHLVEPSMAAKYDYVWVLDEDIRFDFMSWDLYRTVLLMWKPLVSQPSIIPQAAGKKGTGVKSLNMRGPSKHEFAFAWETSRSEQQAVLIDTRVWHSVHARNALNDRSSDWFIDDFWDTLGFMAKRWCGKPGVMVVNAVPVRHMNCHNLIAHNSLVGSVKRCKYGCGLDDANCRNITRSDTDQIRADMKGYCDIPGNLTLNELGDMHTAHLEIVASAGGKTFWMVPFSSA